MEVEVALLNRALCALQLQSTTFKSDRHVPVVHVEEEVDVEPVVAAAVAVIIYIHSNIKYFHWSR